MLRILLGFCLIAVAGAIGWYFVQASRPRAFAPPPATAAVATSAGERQRSVPGPPSVETGPGAPPAIPETRPAGLPPTAAGHAGVLGDRRLSLPIANLRQPDILDTFDQARGGGERRHEAVDIMAPKGTPVLAVDDGIIRKLFTSKPGGLTIYQYAPGEQYCYYYAHLDGYAEGIRESMNVRRGDLIGYVGVTGNSDPNAPHLHFAILELGSTKEYWHDTVPINPYPIFMSLVARP